MAQRERTTVSIRKLTSDEKHKLVVAYNLWKNLTGKEITFREFKTMLLIDSADKIVDRSRAIADSVDFGDIKSL